MSKTYIIERYFDIYRREPIHFERLAMEELDGKRKSNKKHDKLPRRGPEGSAGSSLPPLP